jgi:hypothetical protein
VSSSRRLPEWDRLAATIPDTVTPMRRYLDQLACILRPGSVKGADLALRSLAAFLVEQAPEVHFITDIRRRHIEDFRTCKARGQLSHGASRPSAQPSTQRLRSARHRPGARLRDRLHKHGPTRRRS